MTEHHKNCDWHLEQNPRDCTCGRFDALDKLVEGDWSDVLGPLAAPTDGAGHGTASTTGDGQAPGIVNQNLPTGRDGEQ